MAHSSIGLGAPERGHGDRVSRAELIERATRGGRPVVGITAPAGYGKTTILMQWADLDPRCVAYVAFHRFDDDPARVAQMVASALAGIPGVDPDLVADVSGPGVSTMGRAAWRLAAAIRALVTPFVLLLDDIHELRTPECQDLLSLIADAIPGPSQLVTTSRVRQRHLPRLLAAGTAVEFGIGDLALTADGARRIFEAHALDLGPEQAASLVERVEGWPVGITLAALTARESGGGRVPVTGDARFVADYLYEEALAPLPDDLRAFLRRTAVLEELCAPLCDAILLRSDSELMLREAERSQLFITPVAGRPGWSRYHPLLREFLLSRLRAREPDVMDRLHERAAAWYEANGAPDRAVEHLLCSSEPTRCVELVSSLALATYQGGGATTVGRWLAALGERAMLRHPPLAVLAGDLAVLTGDTTAAERYLELADHLDYDGPTHDGTVSFESSRAILRAMMCRHGPDRMRADAQLSVDLEPASSLWRDGALDMLAQAYLLLGDLERAEALFRETSALAAVCGNTDNHIVAESELAAISLGRDAHDEAATHADRALAAIDGHRLYDYSVSVIGYSSGALVSLRSGDPTRAAELHARGMRARQYCTVALPFLAVRSRLQLARVAMALSDLAAARQLLREAGDVLRQRPMLGVLATEFDALRTEALRSAITSVGRMPLSPAELRVLSYLQTHLTMPEIAERLVVSPNTVRAQVTSIFRKLDASSRTEVVERATEIGLLGG